MRLQGVRGCSGLWFCGHTFVKHLWEVVLLMLIDVRLEGYAFLGVCVCVCVCACACACACARARVFGCGH